MAFNSGEETRFPERSFQMPIEKKAAKYGRQLRELHDACQRAESRLPDNEQPERKVARQQTSEQSETDHHAEPTGPELHAGSEPIHQSNPYRAAATRDNVRQE